MFSLFENIHSLNGGVVQQQELRTKERQEKVSEKTKKVIEQKKKEKEDKNNPYGIFTLTILSGSFDAFLRPIQQKKTIKPK